VLISAGVLLVGFGTTTRRTGGEVAGVFPVGEESTGAPRPEGASLKSPCDELFVTGDSNTESNDFGRLTWASA